MPLITLFPFPENVVDYRSERRKNLSVLRSYKVTPLDIQRLEKNTKDV